MKRNERWAVLLSAALLLLAPGRAPAEDAIKLGMATPLSAPGDYKSGQISVQAAELAVAEINEKGGLLGKQVALVKADDEGKPATGVSAVQRLIANEKVSALVGPWHSSVAVAQAKVVQKMGVPMLMHYTWADSLTEGKPEYIWRVGPFNSEIAQLLMPFVTKKYKNVALMYETTAFGTGFADAMIALAKEQKLNLYPVSYPAEATDLTPQLLELKSKNPRPDLLIVAAVYAATNLIPKQAHEIGLAPGCDILCMWDWPTYPDFWEVLGEKGVGVMYATFESDKLKLSPRGEHFKKTFKDKHGFEPPVYAYFLYDAVYIVAEAIKRSGSSDPKKINEALKDTRFDGTTGVITFERRDTGPVWNQWTGHQLFVKKLTEFKQTGDKAAVIY